MRRNLVSVIRTAAFLGMVLLVGLAAEARAQEDGGEIDYGRERAYIGLGLAYAIPDFADFNSENRDAESTFGFDMRAGYRWHWVAAEFVAHYYSQFDLTDSLRHEKGQVRGATAGPAVKFYPLPNWRIQPYVLGGCGILYTNSRDDLKVHDGTDFMVRPGGGLEVQILSRSIIVFAEGSYVFGIGTKRDLIPVIGGAQIHF